jgi:quercetin dioxygenase-like cupin family protein
MKRKSVWVLLLAVVGAAFYGGNVLATLPINGFAGKTLAKSTLAPLDIKAHTVVPADPSAGKIPASVWETMLKTKGITDMYVQQNTWPKQSSTGWHTHPGPSLVVITQGSVTVYDASDPDCAPHVYSATGDNSFVDIGGGDVHLVRNETDDVAVGYAVQFVPAGAVRRIDEPQPANCSVS